MSFCTGSVRNTGPSASLFVGLALLSHGGGGTRVRTFAWAIRRTRPLAHTHARTHSLTPPGRTFPVKDVTYLPTFCKVAPPFGLNNPDPQIRPTKAAMIGLQRGKVKDFSHTLFGTVVSCLLLPSRFCTVSSTSVRQRSSSSLSADFDRSRSSFFVPAL